jgi:two-component system, cell cycle sensor histidine kinase and response regulator CckA
MKQKITKKTPLNVLYLEDSQQDVELLRELLTDAGYDLKMDYTETKKEFISFLRNQTYDIILSDFKLPGFDAFGALELAIDISPDVPFICVSGSIGEETAIKLIKKGAVDYVLKDRTARLPLAIQRALEESKDKISRRQAEEALHESEEKYRSVIETTETGFVILDEDGKVLEANAEYVRLSGHKSVQEITERSVQEWTAEEDMERNAQEITKCLKKGFIRDVEIYYEWADGRKIPVELNATVLGKRGKRRIMSICRDITDRKQIENALQESEIKYRTLIEKANEAISIAQDGVFIFVNHRMSELLCVDERNLEGKNFIDFVWPEDKELVKENYQKRIAGKSVADFYDFRIIGANGSIIWVYFSAAVIQWKGKPATLNMLTDITERKQAEEALRQSQERYRLLHEYAPIGILLVSRAGEILETNPVALQILGSPSAEATKGINLLTFPLLVDAGISTDFRRCIETGQTVFGEYHYTSNWKKTIRMRLQFVPIFDAHGHVVLVHNLIEDITERRQMEEALRESEESYRKLFENHSAVKLILDPDNGAILDANDAAAQYYGWTREELKHMKIHQINTLSADEVTSELKNAVSDGRIHFEFRHRRADGSVRDVEVFSSRIEMGGKIVLHSIVHDITERRQVENELKKSELKYRSIFENVQDVYYETSLDGTLLEVSPSIEVISKGQYNRADLIGRSIYEFYADAKTRDTIIAAIQKFGSIFDAEAQFKNRDGSCVACSISAKMSFDTETRSKKIIGSMHDISERKRAEEALMESELRFRSLYENASIGLYRTTPDGRILLANPALQKMLGYTSFHQLSQRNLEKEGFEPDYQRKEFLDKIERDGTVIGLESKWLLQDGTAMYVLESAQAIRDAQGKTLYYDGTVEDITERKMAEEQAQESEERFRLIFENVVDGISIFSEDPDPTKRRLIECNEQYAAMAGRSREELLRTENMLTYQKTVDDIPNIRRLQSLSTNNAYQGSFSWIRPDGKENIIEYVGMPVVWRGKRYTIGIDRDITERRRTEEALQTSYAFNELLLQAIPFGMDIVDEQGKVLFLNNMLKKLVGNDGVGQTCWSIYKDNKKQCLDCPLRDGIEIGRTEILESADAFGGRIFQINHIGIMYQEKKAMLELFVDVTDQRKIQNQFMQSQKIQSIGTLAGGIAHDFNNILGIILVYSSLLGNNPEDKKKILEGSAAISKAVDRGAALVRQILTFARQSDVSFHPMSIPELVLEIVSMLRETFPRVIEIKTTIDGKMPFVSADHSQLHQVLLNLSVNARDAMPQGGTLSFKVEVIAQKIIRERFTAASNEHYVCISVSDTGTGIDAKHKHRIFDPFFTTKEKGKGTGLGLSVVYGVMQAHRGFVDVESEEGKGTTFLLFLPVPQADVIEQKPAKIEDQEVAGGTETILLVEDEEDLRNYLQSLFESKGYHVYTAADGLAAIELFLEHRDEIDLVLTDAGLPKMTGIEAFKKLREINPKIKVMLASGYIELNEKSELFKAGVKVFIQKPYNPYEVLYEIRNTLDNPIG